jgi:hypothetical protein
MWTVGKAVSGTTEAACTFTMASWRTRMVNLLQGVSR